jgi:hypothetical protein
VTLAPESPMRACLAVLGRAAVAGRLLGYEGSQAGLSAERSAQLADLMDAIHNIPGLVGRWEDCDESLLVGMLRDYDRKWAPSITLSDVYARVRAGEAG